MDAALALSVLQLENDEPEEALSGLNRIIQREPDRFEAYLLRARVYSLAGNLSKALGDLDLYLTYFPNRDEVIYQKGLILYEHKKYLDAIQSFNRALEMNKGEADYYFARGRAYATTGTTRYAEKDMSMALDLDPYKGEAWFEKGKLSEKLGESSEACQCYKKAYQYGVYEAGEEIEKICN